MHDRELMGLRADTDFTYDAAGRMVLSNEPCVAARRPAPRAFLGSTRTGHIARCGTGEPALLVRDVHTLVGGLPPLDNLDAPPPGLEALRAALERHRPITAVGGGPAFRFPAPIRPSTDALYLTGANVDLVRTTYP